MAFAIGFVVLGLLLIVLGSAISFFLGIVITTTFNVMWFIVTGVLLIIIGICKFIKFPFTKWKK